MLDFRMETFLVVCKAMNFTHAAEALHITQPAVSHHIHTLEEIYGVRLFEYRGKKLSLTRAGQELRQAAVTMKHDVQFLKERLNRLSDGENALAFGATLTIGEFVMPAPLVSYIQGHPEAAVHMEVADTDALLKKLDDGEIDFAIVEGFFPKSEYDFLVYSRERYLAVCSQDYAFVRPVRCVEDLLEERLLVREEGSGTRRILETYLEGRNLTLSDFRCCVQANNIAVLKSLARAGCGVTFLYEAAVREELKDGSLREIPLEGFDVVHDFTFIWRKNSLFGADYKELFQAFT